MQLSPNTQRRILRDSSAQTEPRSRDADVQAHVERKSVAVAATATTEPELGHGIPATCGGVAKQLRCPAEDGKGKPIIARVYVHTKRPRGRRTARKPTAHRREYQGEKVRSIPITRHVGRQYLKSCMVLINI